MRLGTGKAIHGYSKGQIGKAFPTQTSVTVFIPCLTSHLSMISFPIAKAFSRKPFSPCTLEVNAEFDESKKTPAGPALTLLPVELLIHIAHMIPSPYLLKTIISLLSVNRAIRASLLPHGDSLAYWALRKEEPWYLPTHPLTMPPGSKSREEELDWWEAQWLKEGDILPQDMQRSAPWLSYWLQCVGDGSMRSRKRIWRNAETINALVRALGIETE